MLALRICAIVGLLVWPLCLRANQFEESMWLVPSESTIDMQCKADLLKKYQPAISTGWVKDGTPVIVSDRLTLDENMGSLHLLHPGAEDHGLYACQASYWDTVVTTNQIRLHTGPPGQTLGESSLWIAQSNDIVGVSNVWAVSIMSCTVQGLVWLLIVTVLRLRRSRCCGKDYELLASNAP